MRRPSYASVVSTLALFVALGGTAGAATYVVSSSKQIKNGAIRNADVRKGTLKADRLSAPARAQLRAGSSTGPRGDVGPHGDTGSRGPQGARGTQGPQGDNGPTGDTGARGQQGVAGPQGKVGPTGVTGPAGPTGDTGPQGPKGATANEDLIVVNGTFTGTTSTALCPQGTKPIGGGGLMYNGSGGTARSHMYVDPHTGEPSGWTTEGNASWAQVICSAGVKTITFANPIPY